MNDEDYCRHGVDPDECWMDSCLPTVTLSRSEYDELIRRSEFYDQYFRGRVSITRTTARSRNKRD